MSRSVAIIGTRGYPSYYGGFETLIRSLAPFLADAGWNVTVFSRAADATRAGTPDPRITVVETPGMDTKSSSTLSHGYLAARHTVRAKPDVALIFNVANGFFLPMLRRADIPTLINVDGIEWEREKWGPIARKAFLGGARMTARYGDKLIFDSREIAAVWGREFRRDGDFIPYGATDPGPLDPVPELLGKKYVLLVARLVPENSIREFLAAAELLMPKYDVAVVGSSGTRSNLDDRMAQFAHEHEKFHWFGHLSNDLKLNSIWQHAGAYFHGHSAGGTNPALVQAMVCGAPVVARDTVFNREVLGPAGLFTPPVPERIAETLTSVLENPELGRQLSSAARTRGRELYTWDNVCAEYEESLSSLLRDR